MTNNSSRFNQSQRVNSSSAFNKKRLPYNHNNFMINSSRASTDNNDRSALHKATATKNMNESSQQAAAASA